MLCFVTCVKTDVWDASMSNNPIGFFAANCDFDGDQLNLMKIVEHYMVELLWGIHPSSVLLTNQEIGLSSTLNIGVQATIVWNRYMMDGTGEFC